MKRNNKHIILAIISLGLIPTLSYSGTKEALEKLGWKVQTSFSNAFNLPDQELTKKICNGEIMNPSISANLVEEALKSEASICLFQGKLQVALKRATSKMIGNHRLTFLANSGATADFKRSAPWKNKPGLYMPTLPFDDAFNYIYAGSGSVECASGLQLASYTTLFELLGSTQLEHHFKPDQFPLASWDDLNSSNSYFFGTRFANRANYDEIKTKAAGGSLHLVGVMGYLNNAFGESYLEKNGLGDRGENFIITDVTQEAAQILADQGSNAISQQARAAWDLYDHTETLNDVEEAYKKIRAQPLLAGVKIWVYNWGEKSLADSLIQLTKINPRTPYRMKRFYMGSSLWDTEVFNIFIQSELNK